MVKIPAYAEDFSVDWLNQALANSLGGAKVVKCDARDSDIPGQTAEIILIDVAYDQDSSDLPTSLVAKVTSRNQLVLDQVIANYDQYRRETSFYLEFQDCGIAVPHCLYADHNPTTQEMVILMADLAPSISPSWAASPDQVEMALSHLSGFHSKWWNNPLLRGKDWFVQFDNDAFFAAAFGAAAAAESTLKELYEAPELTIEAMAFMQDNLGTILKYFQSRPFTFVHGDYHAKQMFFPTEAGGRFAVIDWQFPFVAQGAWDFARMIGMCMATEERLQRQDKLIDDYLSGLVAGGVNGYDRDEFEQDYKMGLLVSQMIMSIAAADTDPVLFQKECDALGLDWRDIMFDRNQRAMAERDVLSFLKGL